MISFLILCMLVVAACQHIGTYIEEKHPPLNWYSCTLEDGCTSKSGNLTLDAEWRWIHNISNPSNCYFTNTWQPQLCPDNESCARNCALEGADYGYTNGITTRDDSVSMKYYIQADCSYTIGSRVFLMADDTHYQVFHLLNKEISFQVDPSTLVCGLNGALYFVGMDADGGTARYPTNLAGAEYGTGYCDAQCPRSLRFIDGEANVEGWEPSSEYDDVGLGSHGSCCPELDVWNANSESTQFSLKPCDTPSQTKCQGDDCGGHESTERYGKYCDPDGCDFNPFRMGNTDFYGPGATLDSSRPFTVTTQFITDDGTDAGNLAEIRRIYTQNGIRIDNPESAIPPISGDSLNSLYCTTQKATFGDRDSFTEHGGLKAMTNALRNGMVLTLSVWHDNSENMLWLDSVYPEGGDETKPGVMRGTCKQYDATVQQVTQEGRQSSVTFGHIQFGDIDSTI